MDKKLAWYPEKICFYDSFLYKFLQVPSGFYGEFTLCCMQGNDGRLDCNEGDVIETKAGVHTHRMWEQWPSR